MIIINFVFIIVIVIIIVTIIVVVFYYDYYYYDDDDDYYDYYYDYYCCIYIYMYHVIASFISHDVPISNGWIFHWRMISQFIFPVDFTWQ